MQISASSFFSNVIKCVRPTYGNKEVLANLRMLSDQGKELKVLKNKYAKKESEI